MKLFLRRASIGQRQRLAMGPAVKGSGEIWDADGLLDGQELTNLPANRLF
jgi:hypothetical protein